MSQLDRVSTRPLLDKLGVRPGARVALVDLDDAAFRRLLATRTTDLTNGWPKVSTDLIFLAADSVAQLVVLSELRQRLVPNGGIWVVSRKGRAATLRDAEVIAAGIDQGLVDNKVVSFSETHTALRLVIPVRLRAP